MEMNHLRVRKKDNGTIGPSILEEPIKYPKPKTKPQKVTPLVF
jgi:hypothetical protein